MKRAAALLGSTVFVIGFIISLPGFAVTAIGGLIMDLGDA